MISAQEGEPAGLMGEASGAGGMRISSGTLGYASQKLSPDSGSGVNPLVKGYLDRSFAGGGEWKYTDVKHRLAYDVRFEQQYGVQLRTSGKVMVFSVTFLDFLPPKQPAK